MPTRPMTQQLQDQNRLYTPTLHIPLVRVVQYVYHFRVTTGPPLPPSLPSPIPGPRPPQDLSTTITATCQQQLNTCPTFLYSRMMVESQLNRRSNSYSHLKDKQHRSMRFHKIKTRTQIKHLRHAFTLKISSVFI